MFITNDNLRISQLKAILRKYILRALLKDVRLWMFLISAGRLFHSLGAANWKARSVSVGGHRVLACINKGASSIEALVHRGIQFCIWLATTANMYASSMCSWISYHFQIDSSYTCGRAKMMRKRYVWTWIFFEREKKSCVFKWKRIPVDRA